MSVLISSRWLLIVMNRKVIIELKNCELVVFWLFVCGLKKFVKFRFICSLISLFVNFSVVNIICIVKFIVRLISICCVSSRVSIGSELSGIIGICGSEGCVYIEMNIVSLICICSGMVCWLNVGMFVNSDSVCRNGYSIGVS